MNPLSNLVIAALSVLACGDDFGQQRALAPQAAGQQGSPIAPDLPEDPAAVSSAPAASLGFARVREPREGAFSILVPRGWVHQGGIYRVDAAAAGGPLNALAAKCDLAFGSDARGTVMFHVLPDIVYAHVGIGAGYWAPGSVYQGAVVRPIETAEQHVLALFGQLHPDARDVQVLARHTLPREIEALRRADAYSNRLLGQLGGQALQSRHDAAAALFDYTEGDVRFRGVIATGLVDQPAAMTWRNTRSLEFRAPVEEFERWSPVLDVMRSSVRFDPRWVLKEAGNQREQADFVMGVFEEAQRIDREMLTRTTRNRDELMNDQYLVLTGQEEYVNPHTGEVEVATDAWRHRWVTDGGDVFYTDDEELDPNTFMQRGDYRRSPIRPRRNG